MSYDTSQYDWIVVRGENFNCKQPEELKAAIKRAEDYVSDIKTQINQLSSHLRQFRKTLNYLKSKQTPTT